LFRLRPLAALLSLLLALCLLGLWSVRSQTGAFRRVTNTSDEGININPSLSGNGQRIAFESTEDLAHAGGTDHFRAIRADLTSDPAPFVQMGAARAPAPGISQDGSIIAFAAKEDPLGTNRDGNSEIFLFNGSTLRQITNTTPNDISRRTIDGNFLPSLSDDGRFIAFSSNRNLASQNSDGNLEIFIFDTASNAFIQVTSTVGTVGAADAKISGDGSRVAYIRDNNALPAVQRDLVLQERVGGATRLLAGNVTNLAFTYGRAISDDGLRVVYSADIAANSSQVFLFDGRNTNAARQITTLGVRDTDVPLHPSISGDGSRISFATRRPVPPLNGNSDRSIELYTYDIPTGQFARVTDLADSDADGFTGSNRVTEVVSSLNDDGSIVAFNFPRLLSGAVTDGLENTSEIYVTGTAVRPTTGSLTILNEASFGHEPSPIKAIAPDSNAVALGGALSFTTQQAPIQNNSYPTTLGGTTVTVNGRRAQISFVSPTQVNFIVPHETELGTAEVIVTNSDGFQSRGTVTVLNAAPGIFTKSGDGLGEGVVLNANLQGSSTFDPSDGQLRLIIFTTGVRHASQVTATAGGRALTVEAFMASPNMPGMDEVHVLVPADLRGAGTVNLVVRTDNNRDSNPVTITFAGNPCRDITINEVLADPPGSASTDLQGDANHDGARDTSDDEFVELVNTTTENKDISGYQLLTRSATATSDTVRHTFAPGTIFPAGSAIVVFGGGNTNFDPNNPVFGGAQVFKASSGGLSLTNSGGVVTLREPSQSIVNIFSYGGSTGLEGDANQSLTRAPDAGTNAECGNFVLHSTAPGSNGSLFSPGTRVNGTPFASSVGRLTNVTISPPSASIAVGQTTQFTAQARDQFNRPMKNVTITFASDNTGVATVDSVTTDPATGIATATVTGRSQGTAHITAQATDGTTTVTSSQATLTVSTIAPPTSPNEDDVVINEFVVNPTTGKEYVELLVTKTGGVDMRGWTLSDVSTRASSTSSTEGDITLPSAAYLSNVPQGTFVVIVLNAPSGNTNSLAEDTSTGDGNRKLVLIVGATTGLVTSGTIDLIQNENLQLYGPGGRATGRVVDQALVGSNTSYIFAPDGTTVQATFGDNNGATTSDNINGSSSLASNSDVSFCPTSDALSQFQNNDTGARFTVTANSYGTPGERNGCVTSDTSVGGPSPALVINISGRVTDPSGNGIAGVTITVDLEHDGTTDTRTTLTDANGNYSFTNLPGGQDRVFVTPSKDGYTFTPFRVAFVGSSGVSGDFTANFTGSTSSTPLPTITISDAALSEGNSGTKNVGFIVTLSEASTQTVTVDYATAGVPGSSGVATPDTDYQSRSGTLIFNPGVTSRAIVVPFIGDTVVEPNEIFHVNLFNPTNAIISDSQAVGTIINDDAVPSLVISQVYVGGNNSGATYRNDFIEIFNRGTTTIDFSVTPYSVQYTSGSTWAKTDITTGTLAPGRYFLIQEAGGTTNGVALPTPDATGNINLTGSSPAKVALVLGTTLLPASSCPGDNGSQPFNPNNSTVVDFVGYGGTAATADHCYEGAGPAPALTNTTADFRKAGGCVDTNDNAADFLVSTPNPRNSSSPANDCSGGIKPDITINDVTVTEGNSGTINATFTVTLSASATSNVTVDFATADGTATAGSDYQSNNGTLTFAPGVTTQTITVAVNGDTLDEVNETFFVNLSNATNALILDPQGQGTITDDDAAPTISINDVSVAEGDSGTTSATFSVTLSAASGQQITVAYATADGSATAGSDYQATSGTLTFSPGQTTQTINVPVNGDTTFEPNETFVVNLTAPTNATILDNQGQGTITNDDAAPPIPAITIDDVIVAEGDSGTKIVTFTVSLSMTPTETITVDYATANGTATAGSDYQSTGGTLTFNPSETSKTISVTINGDTLVEPDETFFVNLSNASPNSLLTDNQGQGTITNDDTANLVISQIYGGGNNSGAQYRNDFIEIFNRGTTTVDFSITAYSVQYASVSTTSSGNFGGTTASSKTNLTTGTIAPGQYFLIQEAGGTTNGVALPTPDAIGSIAMSATTGKVALVVGTAALPAAFCPGDDGSTPFNPSNSVIADFVGYGTPSTNGHCYEGAGPAPTISNTTADFRKSGGCIDTNNNAADFTSAAPNPRNSASPFNTCAAPGISINDATVTEGDAGTTTATFTVSLNNTSTQTVTVSYATADGTATAPADYLQASNTLTFNPGELTKTINITVNGDTLDEANETFFVNLSGETNATILDGQGLGTITDDDAQPTISINDVTVTEGDSGTTNATFTVTLSAQSGQTVTVTYATANGTATEPSDYQAIPATTLTFNPGTTSQTINVTVNGDTSAESDETFFVNLSTANNATILDNQGQGTITNDDASADLSLTKTVDNSTPNVGEQVVFTITLTNSGPFAATGVSVKDQLPPGLTYVSDDSGGSYNSATGIWTVGTLSISGTATLHITATATSASTGGVTNTAEVFTSNEFDPDSTPNNNISGEDDQSSVTVNTLDADLSITKTDSPDPVAPGGTLTYTITVTNNSTDAAQNVTVTDNLPATVTFGTCNSVSGNGTCGGTGNSRTVTYASIAGGASETITLQVTVSNAATDGSTISNTASVSSATTFDPNNGNNSATATTTVQAAAPPSADLSLIKTVNNATPNVGEQITFTVQLSNNGPDAASGVTVNDLLPPGLTFVTATTSHGTYDSGTGNWTIGAVAVGTNVETLTITALVTSASISGVTNTAEVTASDQADPDSAPNNHNALEDDQSSVTVNPRDADLSLTKTVNNSTPNIGEKITFTINLSNAGSDIATGVQVSDVLPAGLAFVSASTAQGTYNNGTGVWTVGNVNVGINTATLTITATVQTIGAKTNTAEVIASGVFDPDSTPNNHNAAEDDQSSVTVTGASNLIINEAVVAPPASGVTDPNDFVELYNKSGQQIDISGLVISYRPSGATTTPRTFTLPANTIIPAGEYRIIVNGSSAYGTPADFNASTDGIGGTDLFNLNNSNGGIKIELNGVKLDGLAYRSGAGTVTAPFDTYGEGNPFLGVTSSGLQDLIRSPNGTDTNDNAADFRRNGIAANVSERAANPTITP
jgi:uncharacterized repeat protein (TIGR01451 family)